jgi:hypothetical protein
MSTFWSGIKSAVMIVVVLLGLSSDSLWAQQSSQAEPQAGQFRIAGTVVSATGGNVLARARVTIRNVKDPKDIQFLLTGEDGHFEFRVKAGKYGLEGAKRGFITADYDQHEQFSTAIVTGTDFDTGNIVLKLSPSAVLVGKVLDEAGDPVRHANVTLWREDHGTGVSRIVRFRSDVADDQGGYEFTPLDEGTYFLSVSATPWYAVHPPSAPQEGVPVIAAVDRALDVVYPTTYYAGTSDWEDATPILIQGGDHLELDMHLIPVSALHVVFRGEPQGENGYAMPVLQQRAFDGIDWQRNRENPQMISPGVFEMATAPGKYVVQLWGPSQSARINEVDISENHQEVDTSSGELLSKITASVHVLGQDRVPKDLFVGLRDKTRRGGDFRIVNAQGEAVFENVAPGTYELVASSPNVAYAVVRSTSQDHENPGHTVKVAAGSSVSLSLSLMVGNTVVEGYAKQAGKGVAGAMVVLIPKHPEANRELFRRDQSDLDGSFSLRQVIPGSYTVIAITNGWDLDWSKPAVIAKYAARGRNIVVPGEASHPVQLPDSVEVQMK